MHGFANELLYAFKRLFIISSFVPRFLKKQYNCLRKRHYVVTPEIKTNLSGSEGDI